MPSAANPTAKRSVAPGMKKSPSVSRCARVLRERRYLSRYYIAAILFQKRKNNAKNRCQDALHRSTPPTDRAFAWPKHGGKKPSAQRDFAVKDYYLVSLSHFIKIQ